MQTIKFFPVESTYKITNGKTILEIYGRNASGQICIQVQDFNPYFWVIDKLPKNEKIISTKPVRRKLLGKALDANKVYVAQPSDVPLVRDKFVSYEADIPYSKRALIDHSLTPLIEAEAQGDFVNSDYKCKVFMASKIKSIGANTIDPKILAVDIETHTNFGNDIAPQDDPIIMIGLYGNGFEKVLTWKKIAGMGAFVEDLEDEASMLKKFCDIIGDFKPDIICGYFSDGFDMPYLKTRIEKLKLDLPFGLDGSGIRMTRGQNPVAEITGICHLDVFKFAKRIFRTTFTSFKLDYVAKELLGEQKIDVSLAELFTAWSESSKKLVKFAEYNLKDAELTYRLAVKLWPNLLGLTKLVGQTPTDVSRMSFSQLVEWYLIKEAYLRNEMVPNRPDFRDETSRRSESYEGGFVYEPTPGLYKDIAVFDFRSLYPTIISAHNISPDVIEKGDSEDGVLKGYHFSKKRGFISDVIDNVIKERLELKKVAKGSNDKMLESQQLALKTVANSIYGYYGFFGARWYNIECAKAITAYGRFHVQSVIESAKREGLSVIYGDTDSLFITLNGKKDGQVKSFVKRINDGLPGVMELEYEDSYPSGIFVATKGTESGAKKKYALLRQDGTLKIRGFETVRRNLSPIAKTVQEKVLKLTLNGDAKQAFEYVQKTVKDLRDKKIPVEMVIIRTQITRDIKRYANMPPHVAIALRMQEQGNKVGAGTPIEYVVMSGKGIIRDRVKMPSEIENNEYDAEYYISHQVIPSVERILEVLGYTSQELTKLHEQSKLQKFFR